MDRHAGAARTRTPKISTAFDLALSLEFVQLLVQHSRETLYLVTTASLDETVEAYIAPTSLVQTALECVETHLGEMIDQAMREARAQSAPTKTHHPQSTEAASTTAQEGNLA